MIYTKVFIIMIITVDLVIIIDGFVWSKVLFHAI
mgnify:FL=1